MAVESITVSKDSKGWKAKQPKNSRASVRCETQAEAIDAATSIAKKQKLEVRVKGLNGKFRQANSYGHDPRSRKG